MIRKKKTAPDPNLTTIEQIRQWYENGGREEVRKRAKVASASARAMSSSLEVPAHCLDEPVTY